MYLATDKVLGTCFKCSIMSVFRAFKHILPSCTEEKHVILSVFTP